MKIEALHVGMKVRHPQYGIGTVKSIGEHTAEIRFDDAQRTVEPNASGLEPAEAQVGVTGLQVPLKSFIEQTAQAVVESLGLEKPDTSVNQLGVRWWLRLDGPHRGRDAGVSRPTHQWRRFLSGCGGAGLRSG